MRSRLIIGGFVATALLLAASTAGAQAATAAKPAKGSLDQEIKLLRQDVRAEKSRIMLNGLELNADQTAKFLPIYKEFDRDLAKLNDLREANIRDYAKSYNTMSDNKADQLVNQAISYYKKRTDLLATYYDKVRAALGTGIAARFVQIEAMLNNIIDLQIQSSLPLIETPSSG
jgi:Spy/CpxP family protein refolding chaperone